MKRTISVKELKQVLDKMPKKKIEEECNAWGCCSPHYKEMVTTESVMYYVEEFLKTKK